MFSFSPPLPFVAKYGNGSAAGLNRRTTDPNRIRSRSLLTNPPPGHDVPMEGQGHMAHGLSGPPGVNPGHLAPPHSSMSTGG